MAGGELRHQRVRVHGAREGDVRSVLRGLWRDGAADDNRRLLYRWPHRTRSTAQHSTA